MLIRRKRLDLSTAIKAALENTVTLYLYPKGLKFIYRDEGKIKVRTKSAVRIYNPEEFETSQEESGCMRVSELIKFEDAQKIVLGHATKDVFNRYGLSTG